MERAKKLLVKAQNCNLSEVEKLHESIANENFGVDKAVLDELWRDAWESDRNIHLPEVKNNHDIRYLNKVIELLVKGERND